MELLLDDWPIVLTNDVAERTCPKMKPTRQKAVVDYLLSVSKFQSPCKRIALFFSEQREVRLVRGVEFVCGDHLGAVGDHRAAGADATPREAGGAHGHHGPRPNLESPAARRLHQRLTQRQPLASSGRHLGRGGGRNHQL